MTLRPAAVLLALALIAAACAGTAAPDLADGDRTVEEAAAAAAEEATGPDVAEDAAGDDAAGEEPATVEALWWTASTVTDGELFDAADLSGGNVVLWLWAPWCSVCNREAPEVAEALADLPDDVTVIGVAGRDDLGPMRDFIAEHGLEDMTHVVDANGAVWASYGISYQPAWVFIDGAGNTAVAAGALGYDGLFAGIDQVFRS